MRADSCAMSRSGVRGISQRGIPLDGQNIFVYRNTGLGNEVDVEFGFIEELRGAMRSYRAHAQSGPTANVYGDAPESSDSSFRSLRVTRPVARRFGPRSRRMEATPTKRTQCIMKS